MKKLTLFALLALFAFSSSGSHAAVTQEDIAALQAERIKVLESAVEMLRLRYENGFSSLEELVGCQIDLIEAKLDMEKNPDRRVVLLKGGVEMLSAIEKLVKARIDAETVPQSEYLKVKATRLRMEIRLLQEQAE